MDTFKNILLLLARILMSALFIGAAISKLINWDGTIAYMASKNMPYISTLLPAAITVELVGGLAILLGYFTRVGAVALVLFVISAATIFHDFWNIEGSKRMLEMTMFMKDFAIISGLLYISSFGPGRYSIKG